jgi:type II secretory pathway pseudopilin PulG
MTLQLTSPRITRNNSPRPARAFTLIEMLVVIVIIMILIGAVVAVGSMVRANATRRSTLAQLHVLDGAMKDYLDAGNPEPAATPTASWPYQASSSNAAQWYPTNPPSDLFNWIIALKSDPRTAKKLENMTTDTDASFPYSGAAVTHTLILDGYGTPIRYVPSNGSTPGYFISAGPDSKFSNSVDSSGSTTPSKDLRADEIRSTDPQ